MQELKDHRRAFYDAHPATEPYSWLHLRLPGLPPPILPGVLIQRRKGAGAHSNAPSIRPHPLPPPAAVGAGKSWRPSFTSKHSDPPPRVHVVKDTMDGSGDQGEPNSDETDATLPAPGTTPGMASGSGSGSGSSRRWKSKSVARTVPSLEKNTTSGSERTDDAGADADNEAEDMKGAGDSSGSAGKNAKSRPGSPRHGKGVPLRYDPEEYQHAKKQLKKAVLECYRSVRALTPSSCSHR